MIRLKGSHLSVAEAWRGIDGEEVVLAPEAREAIEASRALVERMVEEGRPVYGITTGFGHLASVPISREDVHALQMNLVRSHAAGVGPPLSRGAVRAMMLLRANTLAKGYSGVRPVVLERFLAFLNAGLHPVVPSRGSVGASGDLAPLAHLALAVIGEGESEMGGKVAPTAEHLARLGLTPLALSAKEGLALTNGTQMMTALGLLALREARDLIEAAAVAGSLTLQAQRGIPEAFDEELLLQRPHPGALREGARLRTLLQGSSLTTRPGEVRQQDAYSLRCMPQVHGAVAQAVLHTEDVLTIEMNAATDNPLLFVDTSRAISGGNFHGQPIAIALDYMALAVTELGNASERRTERLVNPALSGLPAFLTKEGGVKSGLMIAQYTAAALTSENKTLAHPASVDTIPTSAGQEDVVSMGSIAALKLAPLIENAWRIVGIEALTACQALDLVSEASGGRRTADLLSPGTRPYYEAVRSAVPPYDEGVLSPYLEGATAALRRAVREGHHEAS